jgi:hypothetical protein
MLLKQLLAQYDDPLRREAIYALVRMAEQERLYQHVLTAGALPTTRTMDWTHDRIP